MGCYVLDRVRCVGLVGRGDIGLCRFWCFCGFVLALSVPSSSLQLGCLLWLCLGLLLLWLLLLLVVVVVCWSGGVFVCGSRTRRHKWGYVGCWQECLASGCLWLVVVGVCLGRPCIGDLLGGAYLLYLLGLLVGWTRGVCGYMMPLTVWTDRFCSLALL